MAPLEAILRARIAAEGSIGVEEFMELALGHPEHGYYKIRDPFGAAGDFVTAPEISQMFGELVGAWVAQAWADAGRPAPMALVELGPGRGTLMLDLLRVADREPGFRAAAQVVLVETSPALRARQAETLAAHPVAWAGDLREVPDLPMFLVANELFDALPIRQFQRVDAFWRPRRVGLVGDRLTFDWGRAQGDAELDRRFGDVADGTIVEVCPAGEALAAAIGARLAARPGAALIIDYGAWDGTGDTLQAVRGHAVVDPLHAPGTADLTAHVRFRALAEAAGAARCHGPVGQGAFLERLGITARARRLAAAGDGGIAAAHRRLTHPDEMGTLFKVVALTPRVSSTPAGFEA